MGEKKMFVWHSEEADDDSYYTHTNVSDYIILANDEEDARKKLQEYFIEWGKKNCSTDYLPRYLKEVTNKHYPIKESEKDVLHFWEVK